MATYICDTKSINMYVIKLANDPHPLKCLLEIPNDYLLLYIKQEAHGPYLSSTTHFPAKTFIHPLFFIFKKQWNNNIIDEIYNSVNQYVVDRSMHGDTAILSSTLARSDHYIHLATIRITTPLAPKRPFHWISMKSRLVRAARKT